VKVDATFMDATFMKMVKVDATFMKMGRVRSFPFLFFFFLLNPP
jgi:hypothetical protein